MNSRCVETGRECTTLPCKSCPNVGKRLGDWLVDTCVAFGAERSTGHKVAGQFLEQLETKAIRSAARKEKP